jgi:cellulose synthase/poly-beta-1,6-N-acetylglucosamine synthase-like glycosyltransferase
VEGLKIAKLRGYEYVAIMDADFDPPEDFLYQTIAPLEANPKLGFIQACWVFVNVNTFLTWAQVCSLARPALPAALRWRGATVAKMEFQRTRMAGHRRHPLGGR